MIDPSTIANLGKFVLKNFGVDIAMKIINNIGNSDNNNQSTSQPQQLTEADILIATKIIEITMKTLWAEESQVLPEASFTDLGADDLDHVTLIMAFEKEFSLSIPDEDAEKIITVGDAFNYIRSKK